MGIVIHFCLAEIPVGWGFKANDGGDLVAHLAISACSSGEQRRLVQICFPVSLTSERGRFSRRQAHSATLTISISILSESLYYSPLRGTYVNKMDVLFAMRYCLKNSILLLRLKVRQHIYPSLFSLQAPDYQDCGWIVLTDWLRASPWYSKLSYLDMISLSKMY